MYANKITIPTDGNELTLVGIIKNIPERKDASQKIRYQYTKSLTKLGMFLDLTEKEYEDLIRKKIGIYEQ